MIRRTAYATRLSPTAADNPDASRPYACSPECSLLDHFVGSRQRARFNGEVHLVVICDSEARNIAALPIHQLGHQVLTLR